GNEVTRRPQKDLERAEPDRTPPAGAADRWRLRRRVACTSGGEESGSPRRRRPRQRRPGRIRARSDRGDGRGRSGARPDPRENARGQSRPDADGAEHGGGGVALAPFLKSLERGAVLGPRGNAEPLDSDGPLTHTKVPLEAASAHGRSFGLRKAVERGPH